MKILLVKLSSLGDVLHNLPVVWDLRSRFPDAQMDWVVEEGYVSLLEPVCGNAGARGIDGIIPIGFRRWKKALRTNEFSQSLGEFRDFRDRLRSTAYDVIIETQGLIKSALVTRLARRAGRGVIAGLANRTEYSGYEPLARCLYTSRVQVPLRCHAVDRSRWVAAAAVDAPNPRREEDPPKFYPDAFADTLGAARLMAEPYALCFHSTARAAKRWSNQHWVMVGRRLVALGLRPVFPWGNAAEKTVSEALASQVTNAVVPDAFSMQEAVGIVAGARIVIGVDTGLTHLAAILGKPTIELYCDSPRWKTEGYWSPLIRNLGDIGNPPSVEQVLAAIEELSAG